MSRDRKNKKSGGGTTTDVVSELFGCLSLIVLLIAPILLILI